PAAVGRRESAGVVERRVLVPAAAVAQMTRAAVAFVRTCAEILPPELSGRMRLVLGEHRDFVGHRQLRRTGPRKQGRADDEQAGDAVGGDVGEEVAHGAVFRIYTSEKRSSWMRSSGTPRSSSAGCTALNIGSGPQRKY